MEHSLANWNVVKKLNFQDYGIEHYSELIDFSEFSLVWEKEKNLNMLHLIKYGISKKITELSKFEDFNSYE